jgi:hypothetical protein
VNKSCSSCSLSAPKLRQFLEGQRDFDDAMTVEDYILPVDVLPDGSILDEDGNCFGKKDW